MPQIEGFRIRNFRALKDVTLGRLWSLQKNKPLTPLTVVIGKNGAGKSTLFEAFGFVADCLKVGVEEACDLRGRGGFTRLRSQGIDESIDFEFYYRENKNARPITYELSIALDEDERPFVQRERLRQRRKGQDYGQPFSFLILDKGKGAVWRGNAEGIKDEKDLPNIEETNETERVQFSDPRKLGIATLGALSQHPRISKFRQFIEGWYLSYFTPDAARSLPLTGPQKHLNIHGDNLGNVVQFMEREYPEQFQSILKRIADKIPGIDHIDTEKTTDGRLLLRFNDKAFKDPFYAQQMSDGTLKVFAYLLLLQDPSPPPFLCIEEPENGLYHKLLEVLAEEFRHSTARRDGPQVFMTTHQPYFVDALSPSEVWILKKSSDGFSRVSRVSDIQLVNELTEQGLPLGGLWYSDYLERPPDAF